MTTTNTPATDNPDAWGDLTHLVNAAREGTDLTEDDYRRMATVGLLEWDEPTGWQWTIEADAAIERGDFG